MSSLASSTRPIVLAGLVRRRHMILMICATDPRVRKSSEPCGAGSPTSTRTWVASLILAQFTIALGTRTLPSETGFRVILIIGAAAALTALAIAAFIPTRRNAEPTSPAPVEAAART
jgi:hypothetical protein